MNNSNLDNKAQRLLDNYSDRNLKLARLSEAFLKKKGEDSVYEAN
jgi:hypothetical protein